MRVSSWPPRMMKARWTTTSASATSAWTASGSRMSPWRYSVLRRPSAPGSNGRRAMPRMRSTWGSRARRKERPISPVGPVTATVWPSLIVQDDARGLALTLHARRDGPDLVRRGVVEQRGDGVEARRVLEVLDRREDQQQLARVAALERAARARTSARRRSPGRRSGPRRRAARRRGRTSCRSGSWNSGGVIQRANGTSASGSGSTTPVSSTTSRTAAARWVSSPSVEPPGKTQAPPMKRAFGVRRQSSTSMRCVPPRSRITVADGAGRWVLHRPR